MLKEEYKGYAIVGDGTFGQKKIQAIKGSLPVVLHGGFTTSQFAKVAIDRYLAEKKKK